MRTRIIIRILAVWMLFFAASKVVFALCCGQATPGEMAAALWHGLAIDLSTTGYFLTFPLLAVWCSLVWPRLPLLRILLPWHVLCALLASAAVIIDASLYPFWQFKLDATVLYYMESPADALASVSWWFVAWRTALWLLLATLLVLALRMGFKVDKRVSSSTRIAWWRHALMPVWAALLFLAIRGGVGASTMNVGNCYHSQRMFMNHVAVNPLFSFIASVGKTEDFAAEFDLLPEDERRQVFDSLYAAPSAGTTAAAARKPNVLLIMWESGGGAFFEPFGGQPDVMVNLQRIAGEGLLFSNMHCNSWRTDRGMVSALSGWFAYPTLTLMRLPVVCDRLPCLGRSFARQGYDTFFLYGGDINFTHTAGYLTAGGYRTLISDKDFTMAQRHTGEWGVQDSIVFDRLYDEIMDRTRESQPWHGGVLTLSSHAPFEVPFGKHADKVLNSMAYTDHHLGLFIDRLKAEPEVWSNLLVVIMPDHGYAFNGMGYDHPLFFRAPMVWTGGALGRHGIEGRIMNQSDMPATLLGSLGFPHNDFRYSRNVADTAYTYPFAYSADTELIIFTDTAGRAVFNAKTLKVMHEDSPQHTQRLKAILQTSYDLVELVEKNK